MPKATYAVMRSDEANQWTVLAQVDSWLDAVSVRETELRQRGGTVHIFQPIDLYDAYQRAGYERDQRDREAAKATSP